jgi:hypothetical protein
MSRVDYWLTLMVRIAALDVFDPARDDEDKVWMSSFISELAFRFTRGLEASNFGRLAISWWDAARPGNASW